MGVIRIKRIYDLFAETDGTRVLVDRIWPRGVSKDAAKLDLWMKDVAPSTELRRWFGHDPSRFKTFAARYRKELRAHPDAVRKLREITSRGDVTMLYAARDREVNHAVVLAQILRTQSRDD